MFEGLPQILLHHAGRHSEPERDLLVALSVPVLQDHRGLALGWQLVEDLAQPRNTVVVVDVPIGRVRLREVLLQRRVLDVERSPIAVLLDPVFPRKVVRDGEEVRLEVLDRREVPDRFQ